MKHLFRELKRRNVYKVAVTYAVVAFVTLQAAQLVFPATTLEGLYDKLVVLAFVGFPIALVLAWAFELTPEGVRRTPEAEGTEVEGGPAEERPFQSRLALKALVGLGLVGAAVAGGWYLLGGGGEPEAEPRAGDRSIAVLPFETLSPGEESETFARGMHDALLSRLSNISGLKVISRTAVQQYRGTELTTGAVADSLGVRWVMEGGVQKMGDQLQVTAQLIDPRTETHAWADTYRRDLTAEELFALQTELTKRIARSLEAELTPEETERVERRPTEDLEAYKLYVRGRRQLDTRTQTGLRQAVDYFQRAIEQDSSYALAWSGLADAISLYPGYGPDSVPASLPEPEKAARRALELDPNLAEAHASMGNVYGGQGNGPAALRELHRAVKLKPSYAQAHHWLGSLLLRLGRLEEAREHVSLAVELNPRHWAARAMLIAALIAEGEVEQAQTHFRQLSHDPARYSDLQPFVLYHAQAWSELEQFARDQLDGESPSVGHFHLAMIAARRDDTAAARKHLAELREAESHFQAGLVRVALGDTDAAFSAWTEVDEWGFEPNLSLRYWYSNVLDPLRDDPRYRELIREINQYWGLNPDGSLPDSVDVSFDAQADD